MGIAACQIARACGLKVLGTAGTEEGMNTVLRNGAHQAFNHREANYISKLKVSVYQGWLKCVSYQQNSCLWKCFRADLHSSNNVLPF